MTVNGVLGESVTLSLKLPVHQDIESITWLHNGKSIHFILPKAAPDSRILVTDPKRKDRLQLMENYSLQLSNLATADAGLYCAQITTQTSTEFSYYTLQVFRRLRNLQIANHTWLSEIGTCEIHLTCSVENSNDTFLRWQVVGNTFINEANLTISWDPRNSSEQKFTCVAENTVSNISFSVSTQSLCEAETIRNLDYVSVSPGNTVYACVTHPNRNISTHEYLFVRVSQMYDYFLQQTNILTPVKSSDFSTIYSTVHQYKERIPISSRTAALDNVI
ncbi:hypothetical protein GH733_010472 [Mirounga leonina]|nr:hypothetical protein GH733_010472 [Mirounga leonina]